MVEEHVTVNENICDNCGKEVTGGELSYILHKGSVKKIFIYCPDCMDKLDEELEERRHQMWERRLREGEAEK